MLKTLIFGARSERAAVIWRRATGIRSGAGGRRCAGRGERRQPRSRRGRQGARQGPAQHRRAAGASAPLRAGDRAGFDAVPVLRDQMRRIGEDVAEALDRVPARLRVLRTIRPKYACRACEGPVVQAKAPARLVEGGMATTALIAHIAAMKYAWQSTLYRQSRILAGFGLVVDRQTLSRWMKSAAWVAKGLYELQLKTMHGFGRLFCDETPMPVLWPGPGPNANLPVLGACDRRSVLAGAGAAGGRLCVRRRSRQEGDCRATGRVRRRAASRRLCRLCLAGGRQGVVGQDPVGVLSRSCAPQLRQGSQDDELALRQGGHRAHRRCLRDRGNGSAVSTPSSAARFGKPRRSR